MRISLGRRQRSVTQHLLDGAKVCASVEHVGRTRVPESMRVQIGAAGSVFPVDVNEASLEELLMVPGIGPTTAQRILKSRPIEDYVQLTNIGVVLKRARPYIKVKNKLQSRLEAFAI